jgi:hypothetical protein
MGKPPDFLKGKLRQFRNQESEEVCWFRFVIPTLPARTRKKLPATFGVTPLVRDGKMDTRMVILGEKWGEKTSFQPEKKHKYEVCSYLLYDRISFILLILSSLPVSFF